MESCISENTLVAAIIKVIKEMMVVKMLPVMTAFCIIVYADQGLEIRQNRREVKFVG